MKAEFKIATGVTLGTIVVAGLVLGLSYLVVHRVEDRFPYQSPYENLEHEDKAEMISRDLLDELERNRERSCLRLVLRGDPLPGRGGDDVLAALSPSPETDVCMAAIDEIYQLDDSDWDMVDDTYYDDAFLPRRAHVYTDAVLESCERDDFEAVALSCSDTLNHLRAAIAHEDACSPFLAGRRPELDLWAEESWKIFSKLVRYLELEARRAHEEQGFEAASRVLLDGVRFSQDVYRGGPLLPWTGRAARRIHRMLGELERLLNRKQPIPEAELLAFINEALVLDAFWPRMRTALLGYATAFAHDFIRWDERRECWKPIKETEQFARNYRESALEENGCLTLWGSYSALMEFHAMRTVFDEACPPGRSDVKCCKRLSWYRQRIADWQVWNEATKELVFIADRAREDEKRALLEMWERHVSEFISSSVVFSMKTHAENRFKLRGLILLALYRAEAERIGTCPGEDFFDSPPVRELMVDPASTKRIDLQQVDDGKFVLRPPVSLRSERISKRKQPAVYIDCPTDG